MKERIALAYSGSIASSAAVAWLMERRGADVVTVTVDVGQTDDLDDVRGRALACGARRAHVVDVRDTFARDCIIPVVRVPRRSGQAPRLRSGQAAEGEDVASLVRLADPLIAKTLIEVATIEGADAVAHAGAGAWPGEPGSAATLEAWLTGIDPSMRIVAPAREWGMDAAHLVDYARARSLPGTVHRPAPHLLIRRAVDPAQAPDAEAHLDIAFSGGIPVAINDVQMTLQELIESLSLIAGQYGLGYRDGAAAPAAVALRAAYGAAEDPDDVVRLTLRRGSYRIEKGSEVGAGSAL